MIEAFFEWLRSLFSSPGGSSTAAVSPPKQPPREAAVSAAKQPPSGFSKTQWVRYDHWFQAYAEIYSIEWKWLKAFALNESRLGLDSRVSSGGVSSDGLSYGLMQFTIPTATDQKGSPATIADLNNPELSIKWAAKYVSYLYDLFDDLELAVQAYNCGQGNVRKGVRVPKYLERWKRNLDLVEKHQ